MGYKKWILLPLFLFSLPAFAYQQQGFSNYQENGSQISFTCTNQCVLVVAPSVSADLLHIEGQVQGEGTLGYGFLVGQQIAPGADLQVHGQGGIDTDFALADSPVFSQLPSEYGIVLLVQGNVQASQLSFKATSYSLFQKISQGFTQALTYKEYNPRTINFLEGPMRNGVYINQDFFWLIVILLVATAFIYWLTSKKKNKQTVFWFGIGVLVFFWVFFDFFSTVNQIKIYQQTMSTTNIMENARVGRSSDFYQFLDFIRTKVPHGDRGAFIAPYPFDIEGKYHIYPDVKFDAVTGVKYILYYNPYGSQAPFGFKDPIYTGGMFTWDGIILPVQEEIARRPYAKIYLLKK